MLLEACRHLRSGATTVTGTLRYVARVRRLEKHGKTGVWLGASRVMSASWLWWEPPSLFLAAEIVL